MAIAIVPLLMIIIGILLYYLTDKGKEPGRAMFWAGFIGIAIEYAHHMIRMG